jgi:hypothetical protein
MWCVVVWVLSACSTITPPTTIIPYYTQVGHAMADVYVSDSVFAQYVEAYGGDAKQEIRDVIKTHAPNKNE